MTEMLAPKVSICIPVYNGERFLQQAVESALRQSYSDFEILIIDNASTDGTVKCAEEMTSASGKVRLYINDQNIGLVGNLNRCLDLAKGDYIKFLMADDLLQPDCLERMVVPLESHQSVKLVTCGRRIIDALGNKLGTKAYLRDDCIVQGGKVITRCLFGGNYIGEPSAVMFRKCDVTGIFREDLPQLSDMDMWFQLLELGDLFSIAKPLCAFRTHAAQMTNANVKSGILVEDNIKLFETYSQKPYLDITWLLKSQHKLLMTYRIWMSRKYTSYEKRQFALNHYAYKFIYPFMPVIEFALNRRSQIIRTI
jgi:glycosyltransferase involved in cell wall biosynthesis